MVDLLPCPFCGEKDHVFFHKVSSPEETGWAVVCGGRTNCAASVGRHVNMTKAEACAAWNTRIPSPNPVAAGTEGEPVADEAEGKLWKSLAVTLGVYDLDVVKQHHILGKVQNLVSYARSRAAHPTPTPGGVTVPEGVVRTVVDDIAVERERQKAVEGWTVEHDDEHNKGQLARAASAYAYFGSLPDTDLLNERDRTHGRERGSFVHFVISELFPVWGTAYGGWGWEWWKPTDRRRDLVKAGALIVAEIERLDRRAIASASVEEGRK